MRWLRRTGLVVDRPLYRRYRNDGAAAVPLEYARLCARERVRAKIEAEEYVLEYVACPCCASQRSHLVSEKDRHGLPMRVVVCMACGLLYTNPRLASSSLDEFYREDAYELDRGEFLPGSIFDREFRKGESILSFLSANGLLRRFSLVVDIGCGVGGTLAAFRDRGFATIGCDVNLECVLYGRSQGLDLLHGNARCLGSALDARRPLRALVICDQILEHLQDPREELSELRTMLSTDSVLFVGVPGLRDIKAHYKSDYLNFLELDHLVHFDLASLTRLVRQAGFGVVAADETIRAAFEPARALAPVAATVRPARRPQAVLRYLRRLEWQRRLTIASDVMATVNRHPVATAKAVVKQAITESALPAPVRDGVLVAATTIVRGLRKIGDRLWRRDVTVRRPS